MARSLYLVLLITLLCSYRLNSQSNDLEEVLLNVDKLYNAGDKVKALLVLEDVLARTPDNITVQEKKIKILLEEDNWKLAYQDIDEYILMYPSEPKFFYLRALLNMHKGRYSKSLGDFEKALELELPNDLLYKVYLNRGMVNYYLVNYDLAEEDFNKAINIDPNNSAAYNTKGMLKYELHDYEAANVEFQRALNFEKDNPITHYNMGMAYFRLEEKDKACYHFNKACTLDNRNACRIFLLECSTDSQKK